MKYQRTNTIKLAAIAAVLVALSGSALQQIPSLQSFKTESKHAFLKFTCWLKISRCP